MKQPVEALCKDVTELLSKHGVENTPYDHLLRDFIVSTVLYHWEEPEPEDLLPIKEGIDEIRQSLKMFKSYKYDFKISIFGSARTPKDHPLFQLTVQFGRIAALKGYKIITGAGPGIMAAGNVGAGPENSFGLSLKLPFESENPVFKNHPEHVTLFNHFFSRKLTFYREAQAIVVLPGGFGTMDEIFQGLASMQTGKIAIRPFVLLDQPDGTFWKEFDEWVHQNLAGEAEYISTDDRLLYRVCFDAASALAEIELFYKNFFSYFVLEKRLFVQLKIKLNVEQEEIIKELLPEFDMANLLAVRERYYNHQTLYVYSVDLLNSRNIVNIKLFINAINQLP